MPVRRDPRTGRWFFRTTVKLPDGTKLRLFGTPGVPGPYHDVAATKVGALETLWSWRDEIARMWRFTKSNAITEGLHNKMEVISRRAYGFRNFGNYRLRVRALCG